MGGVSRREEEVVDVVRRNPSHHPHLPKDIVVAVRVVYSTRHSMTPPNCLDCCSLMEVAMTLPPSQRF